jgi:hypothetical protein
MTEFQIAKPNYGRAGYPQCSQYNQPGGARQ